MAYLNRSAIVVKYKLPFLDWVNSNITGRNIFRLNEINSDNRIFLLEEYGDLDHLDEMLSSNYKYIFEKILFGWNSDKSNWPENLAKEIFDDWFEIEAYSRIDDLATLPLRHESI